MKHLALKDMASVQMGYSFRAGVRNQQSGSVRVIQMKDLTSDRVSDIGLLGRTDMDVSDAQKVHRGDIVLRSRGDTATAAIIDAEPGRAVVAAPLLRIRVTDAVVMPSYIAWYLNQPPSQAYLAQNAEGSNVKMISKRALEELEVTVPALVQQERIVTLARLASHERQLTHEIAGCRDRLLSGIMLNYAEEGSSR